jgi:hypothetical protein
MKIKTIKLLAAIVKSLLLTGFIAIVTGLLAYFIVPDYPMDLVIIGVVTFFVGFACVIIGSRSGIFPVPSNADSTVIKLYIVAAVLLISIMAISFIVGLNLVGYICGVIMFVCAVGLIIKIAILSDNNPALTNETQKNNINLLYLRLLLRSSP